MSAGAACGTLRVAVASPSQEPFPALLRRAIEDERLSVKEVARRLSADAGTAVESERRALQRYLKGDVRPEADKAATLARVLGRPELAQANGTRLQLSVQELILDITARLEQLSAEIRGRTGSRREPAVPKALLDRLEAVEDQLGEQGRAMEGALRALAKEVRALGHGQGGSGRVASRGGRP